MNLQPLVSIGIPTYNQEQYITEAITSCLAQTYSNVEIIIADDHSTDGTYKAVLPFLSDKRVRYFKNKKNCGRVNNYKKLLYEYAHGEWYVNLDGDDFFTDAYFIERAVGCIQNNDDLVLFQALCSVEDKNGNRVEKKFPQTEELLFVDGKAFLMGYPKRFDIFHLGALYKVDKARQLDFYRSNSLRSDSESIARLVLYGRVAFYNRPVGVWRHHDNNETWQLNSRSLAIEQHVFDNIAKEASPHIPAPQLQAWVKYNKKSLQYYYVETYFAHHHFLSNIKFFIRNKNFHPFYIKLLVKYLLRSMGISF